MHDQLLLSAAILAGWWHLVASTKALYLLYWVMRVWYGIGALPWPSKWTTNLVYCCVLFSLSLTPWWLLGQYGVSSCPMTMSSGFSYTPGHPPSGHTLHIAPAHRDGYWNDWQMRCFVSHRRYFTCHNGSLKTRLWSIKYESEFIYYSLLCKYSVCILLATTDDNGCCFGDHCLRRASTILKTQRCRYKNINIYINLMILL